MHAETGNPCGLHRGEEGEFSDLGPWARPGDVDSSSHQEQFGARSVWGLLKPWELWRLQQQVLLEGGVQLLLRPVPGNTRLRSSEREAQLGRRDQLLFLLSKTCEYILGQVRGLDPYPLKLI